MSAPSVFDRFVTRSNPTPAQRRPSLGVPPDNDRRSRCSVDVLSREHDALCLNATDPLEIAAGLEAAGISDRRARAAYDTATVFELAEQIYRQVPRRPTAVLRVDPWARPTRELVARGLVYALPGLLLAGAVQRLSATEALLLLLVSVLGAVATQALSHLYHLLAGRRQLAGAAALLRHGLVGSVLSGVLLAGIALRLGAASWRGAAITVLAAIYLISATVVLLLDRHRLLLGLLSPAVVLSLLALIPHQPLSRGVALTAALGSVVGALVAAWRFVDDLAGPDGPAHVVPLSRTDVAGCLPQVAHGALSMILLSLIPLASLRAGAAGPAALGPVMLPAVLSLGAAEVHLYGFRRQAAGLLVGSRPRAFTLAVRRHLLRRVTSYTLLLVALTAGVALVGHRSLQADAHTTGHLMTYLLLAVALFVASLLVSTGYVLTVATIEGAVLTLDVALAHLPGGLAPLSATAVHVTSAAAFVAVMLVFATVLLGRMVSHR